MKFGAAGVPGEALAQGPGGLAELTGPGKRQSQDGVGARGGVRFRGRVDRPAGQPDRLFQISLVQVQVCHLFKGFDPFRVALDHRGVGIERLLPAAQLLEDSSQGHARLQVVGTLCYPCAQRRRPFFELVEALVAIAVGPRLLVAAGLLQKLAEVPMGFGVGRIEPYRSLQGGYRLVDLLRFDVGVPQPLPALPVEGIQADCPQKLLPGRAVASLLPVEGSEAAPGLGILRVDFRGGKQRFFSRSEPMLLSVDEGERAVGRGIGRIEAQGLLQLLDTVVVAALFEVGDGEVVEGRERRWSRA